MNHSKVIQELQEGIEKIIDDLEQLNHWLRGEVLFLEVPYTEDQVKEYFNCEVAQIAPDGNVWIQGPMVGHWLDKDQLTDLSLALVDDDDV